MRTRREKPENVVLPRRVMPPATVVHWPERLSFWIAYCAPSRPGRIVPEKRTRRPRLTRVWLTFVLTRTATAMVATGLVTFLSVVCTRSWVVAGSASAGNENAPLPSVTTALPRLAKPAVNGNARCCNTTCLPVLPVPVSWPFTLVPAPTIIGWGGAGG